MPSSLVLQSSGECEWSPLDPYSAINERLFLSVLDKGYNSNGPDICSEITGSQLL